MVTLQNKIGDSELRRFMDFYGRENPWVTEATAVSLTATSGGAEFTFPFSGGLTCDHWGRLSPNLSPAERDVVARGVLQALLRARGFSGVLVLDVINELPWTGDSCLDTCPGCTAESTCRASSDRFTDCGGFDGVAAKLIERIRERRSVRQQGATRRGRGRPKNEEIAGWLQKRYATVGNASRVAREAAAKFGLSYDAAFQRIRRSAWYRSMTPAAIRPQAQSEQPAVPSKAVPTLADRIAGFLSSRSPSTPPEIARQLGVPILAVEGTLWEHRERFVCLSGSRWALREEDRHARSQDKSLERALI